MTVRSKNMTQEVRLVVFFLKKKKKIECMIEIDQLVGGDDDIMMISVIPKKTKN